MKYSVTPPNPRHVSLSLTVSRLLHTPSMCHTHVSSEQHSQTTQQLLPTTATQSRSYCACVTKTQLVQWFTRYYLLRSQTDEAPTPLDYCDAKSWTRAQSPSRQRKLCLIILCFLRHCKDQVLYHDNKHGGRTEGTWPRKGPITLVHAGSSAGRIIEREGDVTQSYRASLTTLRVCRAFQANFNLITFFFFLQKRQLLVYTAF